MQPEEEQEEEKLSWFETIKMMVFCWASFLVETIRRLF